MRFLYIFLAITCFAGVYCETNDKHAEITKDCAGKNHVDEDTVRAIVDNQKYDVTDNTKNFLVCEAKNFGVINEDGTYKQSFLDDPKNDPCRNLGGNDQYEIASKVMTCILAD